MKDDKAHSFQNAIVNAIHNLIRHFLMSHVTPPNQYIFQEVCDAAVDSLGVHLSHFRELNLMEVFVPNSYSNCHFKKTPLIS